MQSGSTVQGDSTVLSPLSAESWQPLSVLRVQARGSQPTLLCLQGPVAFNPWQGSKLGGNAEVFFALRNAIKIALIGVLHFSTQATCLSTSSPKVWHNFTPTNFAQLSQFPASQSSHSSNGTGTSRSYSLSCNRLHQKSSSLVDYLLSISCTVSLLQSSQSFSPISQLFSQSSSPIELNRTLQFKPSLIEAILKSITFAQCCHKTETYLPCTCVLSKPLRRRHL